jgi:hypothetical protein
MKSINESATNGPGSSFVESGRIAVYIQFQIVNKTLLSDICDDLYCAAPQHIFGAKDIQPNTQPIPRTGDGGILQTGFQGGG